MGKYNYSCKIEENMACAVGRDLPISTKQAIVICSKIRRMPVEKARAFLERVLAFKEAVPFRRYHHNIGHRPKMGPGRYPVTAAKAMLGVIANAEANAQSIGLATGKLEIMHTCAHKASTPLRNGRHGSRAMKRTHVEVVLREAVKKETEKKGNKREAKPKAESLPKDKKDQK